MLKLVSLGIPRTVRILWNFTSFRRKDIFTIVIISEILQTQHRITILDIKSFSYQKWASSINSLMLGEWEKRQQYFWKWLLFSEPHFLSHRKMYFPHLYFQCIQIAPEHFCSSPMYKSKHSLSNYCEPKWGLFQQRRLKGHISSKYRCISGLLRNSQKKQRQSSFFSHILYNSHLCSGGSNVT